MDSTIKKFIHEQLLRADIEINGNRPWDIKIHDERFCEKVFYEGTLGLGETYVAGWWDCDRLDEFFYRILRQNVETPYKPSFKILYIYLKNALFNMQSKNRAFIVGQKHYDLGNDLFQIMLDKRLTYSCAYWKNASNLDQAQEDKLELICKKLYLKPGLKILDIGCGWGSFAKYAAEKYDCQVVGITVSRQQLDLAQILCKGLPVELRFQDYRDIGNEQFDRIVSVGQMEHVGYKNYRHYMEIVKRSLRDDGLFLLHTIGGNTSWTRGDPWIDKYIFPNGMIPSIKQLSEASEGLFVMEDWHNFGVYYDPTLMAWYNNFEMGWDKIKSIYGDTFYRMWCYYLLLCAGSFRARYLQLWQIVFTPKGILGGYQTFR